jgi:radical SAM protein with 4Fe4S-binding SPASM domain
MQHETKPNPATYDFEKLRNLVNIAKPSNMTIFAGDTFYDPANFMRAFDFVMSVPSIANAGTVSQIQRLNRDMPVIREMYKKANDRQVTLTTVMSHDLIGTKAKFVDPSLITELYSLRPFVKINMVITTQQIMDEAVFFAYQEFVDHYHACCDRMFLDMTIDFNSASYRVEGLEEKVSILYDQIHSVKSPNIIPWFGHESSNYMKSSCIEYPQDRDGIFVNSKGQLVACGRTHPHFDIQPVSALDITQENYNLAIERLHQYKRDNMFDPCKMCDAILICNKCPKYFQGVKFTGDSAICQVYKTLARKKS